MGLGAAFVLLGLTLVTASAAAVAHLSASVERQLLQRVERAGITFAGLPDQLRSLAQSALYDSTADLLDGDWLDPERCRHITERVSQVGWVKKVEGVRRTPDARFEVLATYRVPVAMLEQQGQFLLVDVDGARLPGTYRQDRNWPLIQGVRGTIPAVGQRWEGADVAAGLTLLSAIQSEPFAQQISAVVVGNHSGRVNPQGSHIELATDRGGGRIRWGSAPGGEVEENTMTQKLAILRANFQRTGRVDAHHPVIDVSTFANGYIVPG